MANLLDEASILLSPTAYNDGSMLAIKPENGDGDFTFSRNSAATRVNAQGLVENVQILSSNLVTNGDFATDSVWNKSANWSIANGKATSTGSGRMFQSIPFLETNVGTKVVVSFDIVDYTSGGVIIYCYGGLSENFTGVGTHTFTAVTTNTLNLYINNSGQGNLVGSIDNVSVKVITDDTNLPRIDYTDGCGSWLLEPQSTNTITHSEDFSNSFYIKDSGVSLGSSNNTSPSGEINATQINVTNNGRIYANTTSNTYYTSVFIKAGTFSYFKFLTGNIDLVAKTNSNGSIEDYGNGWFRIGVAVTSVRPFQIQAYPDGTYAPHTTAGSYYIWGAQLEVQSFATSYIPTQGASSTRLRDIAKNSGNSSLINSEEGVLYVEIAAFSTQEVRSITLSDGTGSNKILISYNPSNRLDVNLYTTGGYQAIFNYTGLTDSTAFNKIAFKYKLNDCQLWVNGVKVGTDTNAPIMPIGLDRLNFASQNAASIFFYGKTKALAVYKTALTDEQLTALTTI